MFAIQEDEHSDRHSSDTSDIDGNDESFSDTIDGAYAIIFTSDDDDQYDGVDCCFAAAHTVHDVDVPAPSLLYCGDVESDPGPLTPVHTTVDAASSLLRG